MDLCDRSRHPAAVGKEAGQRCVCLRASIELLRILSVYGAANWEVSSWNIERTDRELILVSEEPIAYVVYLTNRVPASQFSPVFVEALAHLLAAKLAGAIMPGSTGADVLTKQLQAYEMYAQKAMALDARQVNESMRIRTPYTGDLSLRNS